MQIQVDTSKGIGNKDALGRLKNHRDRESIRKDGGVAGQ